MATASIKVLRRQAARCAALASQTQDDDSRQRYQRLEQMYLQFIAAEEQAQPNSAGDNIKPAA
jgi:hypothetical protein